MADERKALLVAFLAYLERDRGYSRPFDVGSVDAFLAARPPQALAPTLPPSPWLGPIRCAECGGTDEEPRGECGGVLHGRPPRATDHDLKLAQDLVVTLHRNGFSSADPEVCVTLALALDALLRERRAQPEAPLVCPECRAGYGTHRLGCSRLRLTCAHNFAPGECAECDGGSTPEMVSEWHSLDPPAPPLCPECRDRPGHIAINGQETACGTCGRTWQPDAIPVALPTEETKR